MPDCGMTTTSDRLKIRVCAIYIYYKWMVKKYPRKLCNNCANRDQAQVNLLDEEPELKIGWRLIHPRYFVFPERRIKTFIRKFKEWSSLAKEYEQSKKDYPHLVEQDERIRKIIKEREEEIEENEKYLRDLRVAVLFLHSEHLKGKSFEELKKIDHDDGTWNRFLWSKGFGSKDIAIEATKNLMGDDCHNWSLNYPHEICKTWVSNIKSAEEAIEDFKGMIKAEKMHPKFAHIKYLKMTRELELMNWDGCACKPPFDLNNVSY